MNPITPKTTAQRAQAHPLDPLRIMETAVKIARKTVTATAGQNQSGRTGGDNLRS
jgi:hypothetical protein